MIDFVCPTLWRHDRLAGLVENIHDTTVDEHVITFVAERHDQETIRTVEKLEADDPSVRLLFNERTANCLGAFNTAIPHITAPWWFGASDDIVFTPEWDVPVRELAAQGFKVVGTNDLHNPLVIRGVTATHMLINTEYIRTEGGTLDQGPGIVCFEGYHHNFFDTEMIEVAKQRGVWVPCLESVVEHMHWVWGLAAHDKTYHHSFQNGEAEVTDRGIWAVRRQMLDNPEC